MRVIMASTGSRGDVFPYLALGQALKARSHEVALITTPDFQAAVETAGLEYVELLDQESTEHVKATMIRIEESNKWRFDPRTVELLTSIPARMYRHSEDLMEAGNTILLTSELYTMGAGRIIRAKLGIPYVSAWVSPAFVQLVCPRLPFFFRGIEDGLKNAALRVFPPFPALRRNFRALEKRMELTAEGDFVRSLFHSQDFNIFLFPREFRAWPRDRMTPAVYTNFAHYEPPFDMPEEVDAFLSEGDPPVVFTNASWRRDTARFFQTSAEICGRLNLRGIFLGANVPDFTTRSQDIIATPFVPLRQLLSRSRAIVHSGGVGTVATAIAAEVPQLFTPSSLDNRGLAERSLQLKLGDSVPYDRYRTSATKGAAKLSSVLASAEIRESVRVLKERVGRPADFGPLFDLLASHIRRRR